MENLASNCTIEHTIDLLQNKYKNLNMGGKMSKAFINILSNLSHSINILYIATNLISFAFSQVAIEMRTSLRVPWSQILHFPLQVFRAECERNRFPRHLRG